MRFYVHYTIWNKESHIPWICEGIKTTMPKGSIVDFVFDNCTDNSLTEFLVCKDAPPNHYGSLDAFEVRYFESKKKLRIPNTNDAMKLFMMTDCEIFFSPQDDMKIQDKFVCENIQKLYSENTNIGLVGMRDGFDFEGHMFSSCHSYRTQPNTWLRSGEYRRVRYVNDGPLCLNKKAIKDIGYFCEEYWAHYIDNDYCFKANSLGFNNFVMGAEIVHEKWGRIEQSEVWNQEYSTHDYEVYRRRWP